MPCLLLPPQSLPNTHKIKYNGSMHPDDQTIHTQVVRHRTQNPATHAGKLDKLPAYLRLNLLRELASGTTAAHLAKIYDVTPQAISEFKRRNQGKIAFQQQNIEDEFAALWIARKANRIAAYEDEYERLDRHENADHHLWSLARQAALKNVAEELGQLPPRQTVTINAVTHVVQGVDIEDELT